MDIQLIDTDNKFQEAIALLEASSEIAFDLEYDDNRYTYGLTLCLIQVATRTDCFLVDPFAIKNLSPLWDIFQNPKILKIAHSACNDITLLKKMRCKAVNVIDTDIAARILNYARTSLAAVLEQDFNLVMDKTQQVSNWNNRPLTQQQIDYAAKDVIYLHQIKDKLLPEIIRLNRLHWLKEESSILEQSEQKETTESHLRLKGAERLSPYNQLMLKSLYQWRDRLARELNKPAAYVISNDLTMQIAQKPIDSFEDWTATKGLHGRIKDKSHYTQYIKIITQADKQANELKLGRIWVQPPYAGRLSGEKAEKRKSKIQPVHQKIVEQYGEFASQLILSQGNTTAIGYGKDLVITKKYAMEIIEETAAALGIDLSSLKAGSSPD